MTFQTVGINNLTRPISIRTKEGTVQQTIATIDLRALLPHDRRCACIDIMVPLLAEYAEDMDPAVFPEFLATVKARLQAKDAEIKMSFPYFITKRAPVTSTASLMEYQCTLSGKTNIKGSPLLSVQVPITTLCPCSKEISTAGAHNQRAELTLTIQPSRFIWLEDLIGLAEKAGSCEVYALLKRPDEKHVTEEAYANPMFVEDVARKTALMMRNLAGGDWFTVEVESFESIHKHSAYAYIDANDMSPLT